MRRRTVCIDCRYIRERPSGIATIVEALVEHLPRLAPDLDFLFLRHPKARERLSDAPNTRQVTVKVEANGPATMLVLPRLVDLKGVDLFHATFNILPHGLTMPTVVTLCDVMWMKHADWARAPGLWGLAETVFYRHGIAHALKHATRLVAISEATRREIGTVDHDAIARTRVSLEGVALETFHPRPDGEIEGAKARHLPGVKRYVLSVGQFAGYKNHATVVRAFARAFGDRPDVHLALVQRLGEGSKILTPIARSLGVVDRVHFLSGLSYEDLACLFAGALCLCHPSLYEGFGNCPAEAMAAGCPVVTSNRSSMPEVSAGAAILVDPESSDDVAKALRRIDDDDALRRSMRDRGLARAKELTWLRHAEQNLAVYREILG